MKIDINPESRILDRDDSFEYMINDVIDVIPRNEEHTFRDKIVAMLTLFLLHIWSHFQRI